jgi:hypothetical protein
MADRRYYAKLDVGYLGNPKIAPLLEKHPRAVLLHSWGILYSKQHGTDGVIPFRLGMRELWIDRCSKQCGMQCESQCDLGMLVQNGLFEVLDDAQAVVHDYLEHQDSSETIKKASDKARRAAEARWDKARNDAPSTAPSTALSNAGSNAKERRGEDNSGPRKRGTRIPDDFEVTDQMRRWAAENASNVDPDRETANFVDFWSGKAGQAATKVDWPATWRKWMRTASDRTPTWRRPPSTQPDPDGWMNA